MPVLEILVFKTCFYHKFKIYKHRVSGGQFNVFRNLKMHKSVGKPKFDLPYISPYLNSISTGCVQNISTDAAIWAPVLPDLINRRLEAFYGC